MEDQVGSTLGDRKLEKYRAGRAAGCCSAARARSKWPGRYNSPLERTRAPGTRLAWASRAPREQQAARSSSMH